MPANHIPCDTTPAADYDDRPPVPLGNDSLFTRSELAAETVAEPNEVTHQPEPPTEPDSASGGELGRELHEIPGLPLADAFKVVAAYAVIWIHTPRSDALIPTTSACRFAVPFFVALSIFFVVRSVLKDPNRSLTTYAWLRFQRIYFPFLVWSAIYLLFKAAKLLVASDQANDFPGWEVFLFGATYHLWFLPFIFLSGMFTFINTCRVARSEDVNSPNHRQPSHPAWIRMAWLWGIAAVAATLVVARGPVRQALASWHDSWGYMCDAVPAALAGGALAWWYHAGGWRTVARKNHTTAAAMAVIAACGLAAWGATLYVGRSAGLEAVSGIALLLLAAWPWHAPYAQRWLAPLARYAYGIYLSHLLALKVFEAALQRLGWPPTPALDLTTFVVTAVATTMLVALVDRSSRTRWLVQ